MLHPLYQEPFRSQFHFTPERNWMNDPNGMVYHDGEYHLFYQYNPLGDKWGHMSWGHAVSRDLVHWKHLPVALAEEGNLRIYSGSAVVDFDNSSGFGTNSLVAIYTGHRESSTSERVEDQRLAYSNDRGRTWTHYPGNPVLDVGLPDFFAIQRSSGTSRRSAGSWSRCSPWPRRSRSTLRRISSDGHS